MSIHGVRSAHGRLKFCGTCGTAIIFVEARVQGEHAGTPQELVTLAVASHFRASPRCSAGGTFGGGDVVACRCTRVIPVPRDDGLWCAHCDGLVSPSLTNSTRGQLSVSSPKGGSQ